MSVTREQPRQLAKLDSVALYVVSSEEYVGHVLIVSSRETARSLAADRMVPFADTCMKFGRNAPSPSMALVTMERAIMTSISVIPRRADGAAGVTGSERV